MTSHSMGPGDTTTTNDGEFTQRLDPTGVNLAFMLAAGEKLDQANSEMAKSRDVIKELVAGAAADLAKIEVLQADVAELNAKFFVQERVNNVINAFLEIQRDKIQELHLKVAELQHRLQNEPPPPSS